MSIYKQVALLALLGLTTTNAFAIQGTTQEVRRNRFGAMEVIEWGEEGMKKTVMKPLRPFHRDYMQQAEFLNEAANQIKVNQLNMADDKIYTCSNREPGADPTDAGQFIPIFVGALNQNGQSLTFTDGMCFQQLTFTYNINYDEVDPTLMSNVTLTINAKKPKSVLCKDWFFIGNTEVHQVETITSTGNHVITFTNLDQYAQIDMAFGGLKIYMFCEGYIDAFISVFKSVLCFAGGLGTDPNLPIMGSHVPAYMEKANVNFLNQTMGYDLQVREVQEYDYDLNLIQSGDFLAIMRLDGVDPIIMYGSGTHAGHSTMALRFDGELYIVESQDGWYWPIHGIQRNKFSDWIQWARNADFHVVHLPLSPESRAKFNEKAAQDFFFLTEGLPYGYHNFLFGWIDTAEDNWPPLLPSEFVPIAFSIFEQFSPSGCDIFFDQAMNKRLGTTGLQIDGIAAEAAKKQLRIDDVMALPEIDGWEYTGQVPRDGWSYVCSAYVAAMYKAAGLFDDMEINATEFTPKDVYTLNFFDLNFQRPDNCVAADPNQPYCQILGKYRMTFPGYATIAPYSNMCESCPTLAPDYIRPDGC